MGKPIIRILSATALTSFAATSASAMPIALPLAPTSSVEQVGWVCNEWGRCWWQPNYYRPYGYYRYRYDDDDDWRRRYRYRYGYYGPHPHYWGGYGGWRRDREDDDD
jgi:hypothetical protein